MAQPAYLVAEVALALLAGVRYSLADDTISALGTSCSPGEGGCSSAPLLMNLTFIGFGILQALGALPLLRDRGRPGVVGWLWVVAGVSSVGVGLLPVDAHRTTHSLVALPVFVAQPLALLLHARLLAPGRLRQVGLALATVALAGVVAFAALLGADHWSGLLERAAIWPAKLWLPLAALAAATAAGRGPSADAPPPGPPPGGTAPASPPTAPGR
nr:DUF998 domain-containing protein [Pedococcus badiiscoriae]